MISKILSLLIFQIITIDDVVKSFSIVPSVKTTTATTKRIIRNGNNNNIQNIPYSFRLFSTTEEKQTTPNYNAVKVAKKGGMGERTASQRAVEQNLSLGAPPPRPDGGTYITKGGLQITANVDKLDFTTSVADGNGSAARIEELVDQLDSHRGVLLTSSYEFPGRYARWSLGFVDPPLEISGRRQDCTIRALNDRGKVLLPYIEKAMENLRKEGMLESVTSYNDANKIEVRVVPPSPIGSFPEEERSKQPSLFSVVRSLIQLFGYDEGDEGKQLGLYGGFGYDLTFQFEPIDLVQERDEEQRDLVLFLPDKLLVVDQDKRDAWTVSYEFGGVDADSARTEGMERVGQSEPFQAYNNDDSNATPFVSRDTPQGEFANSVENAKREFAVGNLFETVLSQTFREKLSDETKPSTLFRRLRSRNPAPYGFMMNLGEQEYLVGASPEMFVRCESVLDEGEDSMKTKLRVETCPISGTVARGADALEDAQRVKSLMMNAKEESELTMCTDVDRNDKSRICEPGSVKVIGRRQIEMYSRLIHTVDHVEGYLRDEFDALDAFLCHTWAVTVTGAPKTWAIQFVEENERSPRCWYGGAVGMVGFDGSMNTGLTLRTVRVKDGIAEVRAGATLLYDSNPPAEELETELKASAMIDAIVQAGPEDDTTNGAAATDASAKRKEKQKVGADKSVVLIDHEDSFVHTLGNYLRQTGASVQTLRSGPSALDTISKMEEKPDLVVLSPGPGNPNDFQLSNTIDFLIKHEIPAFGVCLGLQGMVEHFGGKLGVLGYPMHGKPSMITKTNINKNEESIFTGLPETFEVARYHSLYGIREKLPDCLEITAVSTEDRVIMGIQHKTLPMAAVQFHPESILTSPKYGVRLLENALRTLEYKESETTKGATIVANLESLQEEELKIRLSKLQLSTAGSKSDYVVRLALWEHKSNELKKNNIQLQQMAQNELESLCAGLGLKVSGEDNLVDSLEACLLQQ